MSPMLTIAKREFRSYFASPIAYIVICLSFFALGLMFFFLNGGLLAARPRFDRALVRVHADGPLVPGRARGHDALDRRRAPQRHLGNADHAAGQRQ